MRGPTGPMGLTGRPGPLVRTVSHVLDNHTLAINEDYVSEAWSWSTVISAQGALDMKALKVCSVTRLVHLFNDYKKWLTVAISSPPPGFSRRVRTQGRVRRCRRSGKRVTERSFSPSSLCQSTSRSPPRMSRQASPRFLSSCSRDVLLKT